MSVASIGRFVQDLSVFTAVRESSYVYPIVLSTHLACIATFGGLILITDLRLLGWMLTDMPIDDMIRSLRPWKQAGFAVMATCGVLLAASKAEDYLTNPYFVIKMMLLLGVGVHGLYFRRTVYRPRTTPIRPSAARAAGVLSLILWISVVSMGRWIAYYDRPSAEARQQTPVAARPVVP
jgi:hypothetical protein